MPLPEALLDSPPLELPALCFTGRLIYARTLEEMASACAALFEIPSNAVSTPNTVPRNGAPALGFDIEWKPESDGKHETAVLQLACMLTSVVFHLSALPKNAPIPEALLAILCNPNITKAGVGAIQDAKRLESDFRTRGLSSPENGLKGVVNCERMAKCDMGLAKMCEIYLERALPKDKKIQMSNWEMVPRACPCPRLGRCASSCDRRSSGRRWYGCSAARIR